VHVAYELELQYYQHLLVTVPAGLGTPKMLHEKKTIISDNTKVNSVISILKYLADNKRMVSWHESLPGPGLSWFTQSSHSVKSKVWLYYSAL